MRIMHDYLLVKEVIEDQTIEGTKLKVKYDDTERFMRVEVIQESCELAPEYIKVYPTFNPMELRTHLKQCYSPGTQLIINRVAKTPYKDGLFFISFKDVIAVEKESIPTKTEEIEGQLTIFDME